MTQIIVTAERSEMNKELCTYVKGVLFCCSRMANAYFIGTVRVKNPELRHNIKPGLFIYAKNEDLECNKMPIKFTLERCNFCGAEIKVCAIDPHWELIPVKTRMETMRGIGHEHPPRNVVVLNEEDIWNIEHGGVDPFECDDNDEEDEIFSAIIDAIRNNRKILKEYHLKYISNVLDEDLDYLIHELRDREFPFQLNTDQMSTNLKRVKVVDCLRHYM